MKISIFGLGYVGAVTAGCLTRMGHRVIGVDPDAHKLRIIREGRSPILEEGLDELIQEGLRRELLRVTDDCDEAIRESEISLVCVGTPSLPNGGLRTEYVERVSAQIGKAIRATGRRHSVVVRSTVLPGTTERIVVPILERETGGRAGEAFGISMHPEFLREGASVKDFFDPPFTVVGTPDEAEFERVCGIYEGEGQTPTGDRIRCAISTAESMKYGCNIFHALKITFANEIGMMCRRAGVDAREVMDILCRDEKLNISSKYMKPGFAFGGSCLPKDLRASVDFARKNDVQLPVFEATLASNRLQIEQAAARILATGKRRVAMMGISFKEGTDDLRESPLVHLAEILHGRGLELRIYDPNVQYASLYGANKEFIERELPHLKSVLVGGQEALKHAEVVVFGHNHEAYRALLGDVTPGQRVLDLVGMCGPGEIAASYEGLYW